MSSKYLWNVVVLIGDLQDNDKLYYGKDSLNSIWYFICTLRTFHISFECLLSVHKPAPATIGSYVTNLLYVALVKTIKTYHFI